MYFDQFDIHSFNNDEYNHILKVLIGKKHTDMAIHWLKYLGQRELNFNYLLAFATATNNDKLVEIFISHGADPRYLDSFALKLACMMGYYGIAKKLIDAGANVKTNNDYFLAIAASNGHNNIVRLLLENGANAAANNNYAVKWAYINNHLDTVNILLENGGDRNNITNLCSGINIITCEIQTTTFWISRISYNAEGRLEKIWTEYDETTF